MAKYAKNFNKNKRIALHDEAMEQVNGGITYPPVIPEEWQTDAATSHYWVCPECGLRQLINPNLVIPAIAQACPNCKVAMYYE